MISFNRWVKPPSLKTKKYQNTIMWRNPRSHSQTLTFPKIYYLHLNLPNIALKSYWRLLIQVTTPRRYTTPRMWVATAQLTFLTQVSTSSKIITQNHNLHCSGQSNPQCSRTIVKIYQKKLSKWTYLSKASLWWIVKCSIHSLSPLQQKWHKTNFIIIIENN